MTIGKKQLVLASLCVGLSLAVYLNWQFGKTEDSFTAGDILSDDKNYGAAVLTSASSGEALAEAKITRDSARAEVRETLAELSSEETEKAAMEYSQTIEKEARAESVVKSKGIDCVVYLSGDRASVTAYAPEGLSEVDALRIEEAVISECAVPAENIVIVEVK